MINLSHFDGMRFGLEQGDVRRAGLMPRSRKSTQRKVEDRPSQKVNVLMLNPFFIPSSFRPQFFAPEMRCTMFVVDRHHGALHTSFMRNFQAVKVIQIYDPEH